MENSFEILMKSVFKMKSIYLIALAIIFSSSALFAIKAKDYNVIQVIDGDTVVLSDGKSTFTAKMVIIDAPELKQPFGQESKDYLSSLVLNEQVKFVRVDDEEIGNKDYAYIDSQGRTLGYLYLGKKEIQVEMLKAGLAFYARPECKDFPSDEKKVAAELKKYNYFAIFVVPLEAQAKVDKIGMWKNKNVEKACDYRKRNKIKD